MNDYINMSGGLTRQGSIFEITITYPNGITKVKNLLVSLQKFMMVQLSMLDKRLKEKNSKSLNMLLH